MRKIVKHSFATLALTTIAFAPLTSSPQPYADNDTPMQTPAETAQWRAKRDALKMIRRSNA
jgi:hypothetical protein